MSERKKPRQATLFSFFRQPSKEKKDQSFAEKSKKTPWKRNEKQAQQPSVTSNHDYHDASSPTTTDVRARPVVSPIEATIDNDNTMRDTNTRKRPRPKPSAAKQYRLDGVQSISSNQHSPFKLNELGLTGNDKLKQSKDDSSQQQDEVSTVTNPIQNQSEENVSSDDDSENDETEGMSAYELLRQRNIERNNARLASLGLLNSASLESVKQQTKKKPRRARKTPSTAKAPCIPTRRSTRSRRNVLDATAAATACLDIVTEESSHNADDKAVEQEEEETYTVSPLLQYAMGVESSTSSSSSKTTTNGSVDFPSNDCATTSVLDCGVTSTTTNTTTIVGTDCSSSSLHPMGPRLVPPTGLKAIYSLDFSEPFHSHHPTWLVGAGKAGIVALWDCNGNDNGGWSSTRAHNNEMGQEETECIDPALTWKAHNGRWIAEARFLPSMASSLTSPSRLVTAANDGKLCLWDLSTVSVRSGAPKLLSQSGADLHTSGIFAMDVATWSSSSSDEIMIATGSKDKSVALSVLGGGASNNDFRPIWKSNVPTAKVGAVRLHPTRSSILASASDDDLVSVHDYKCGEQNGLVVQLENAHHRPHSVVWDPQHSDLLMTAGLDKEIKIWDIRSTKEPIVVLHGHVPENTPRCKRIHHPTFYYPERRRRDDGASSFVLSGGERSQALSMFHHDVPAKEDKREISSRMLYSRGKLPVDCGDAGCIAVNDNKVAVSVDGGEILILSPIYHDDKKQ
ncbi:unnamed protein product [Cylindrotheca closterium]|uniref:WD40 repeat-like protein n=1 Tax=Cylindrotheca closterium TaxID=2856 RepID=A0AAD2G0F6_9STRA|nr:unnamed protein product [Cylindrotheca closterium]